MVINPFENGSQKKFSRRVTADDLATFESGNVHPVYSTFSLARDAEWCCRLFVLEMKEADEEGMGTYISIDHLSPALIGQTVDFTAVLDHVDRNEVVCSYKAMVGNRLIARGIQKQKILKKEKVERIVEASR